MHGDNRGWFKENYQKEKMEALGLPEFDVVQNNFSYNNEQAAPPVGCTQNPGKSLSALLTDVFWRLVDLRAGESFGKLYHRD